MTTVTDSGGARWNFWIDRGGTFTDVVARREDGRLTSLKLLSENPGAYEDAAVEGIRRILNAPKDGPLPAHLIASVRMGTTVATNALLERKGAPLVFVTTAGFMDQLAIAYQDRPHIFALNIERPEQLYERVIEVEERVSAEGEVLRVPDTETVRDALEEAHADGLRAAAVCFLHGYRYHEHERRVAAVAREVGFEQVSVSHEVSPLMKFVGRGDTTVVDAYLSPILRRYVDQVAGALDLDASGGRLYFMQSNGGLTQADLFQGKDAILSGPAGGVVGMARVSEMAGYDRVIGFDMGGTSTDVSHYNGTFERTFDSRTAGVRVRAPMMVIHTVAAGGGSILHFDGQRLRAGPDSAGADPGPACYRKGGPLTVTDANVMTGKLDPAFFPAIFGPGADEPLDAEAVQRGFDDLCERIGDGRSPEDVADGFIAVAVENMAQAIKKISVARGHDVTRYTLTCFGGAAAQHACMVADRLGIATILIHPLSGVLSAYGMGLADITAEREEAVECPLDQQHMAGIRDALSRLEAETRAELAAQDVPHQDQQAHGSVLVRYEGTDTALAVEAGGAQDMAQEFEAAHRQRFGFAQSDKKLIAEAVSVQAVGSGLTVQETPSAEEPPEAEPQPSRQTRIYSLGQWHDAPIFRRTSLKPGHRIPGPAIVTEEHATIVIEDGWQAEITPLDHVRLKRQGGPPLHRRAGAEADPVMLEIFNNLFMSSAEQMGAVLENTATSVNIRERLDFSCAVFDREGNLVANAPHIPVHLGSMSDSVRSIIAANRDDLNPGDVFALNAPYNGGTHLPDITVAAPVFDRQDEEIIFYVAARGHHADVGGLTPGSMPALSQTIQHEGVLIDNFRLVHRGRFEEQRLRNLLASDPYPARNPDQNVADLKAQIAACERGIGELRKMVDEFGLDVVHAYMGHVQDNAEENVRRVIGVLRDSEFTLPLDIGAEIRVSVRVDRERRSAEIDFTGSSPRQPNNFNAPASVVRAAVLYVFRCLVADEIPLNDGCLKPLNIILPEDCFLNPRHPAAVVAGNVETSQAVTNALFGALGALAAAQGTMNNLTFGNSRHQYYETLCGGAGAGPDFDGADAVHTHMTNSRLTDPEVLEWRYPVRVERFEIRRGSGGAGRHRGGDGVIRELTFLEPMTASMLSLSRKIAPFGIAGGEAGMPGRNRVLRTSGEEEIMEGRFQTDLDEGDRLIVETPGGGGFGEADERSGGPRER